jgi:hypothetical protein
VTRHDMLQQQVGKHLHFLLLRLLVFVQDRRLVFIARSTDGFARPDAFSQQQKGKKEITVKKPKGKSKENDEKRQKKMKTTKRGARCWGGVMRGASRGKRTQRQRVGAWASSLRVRVDHVVARTGYRNVVQCLAPAHPKGRHLTKVIVCCTPQVTRLRKFGCSTSLVPLLLHSRLPVSDGI